MISTVVGLGVSGLAFVYSKLKYTDDDIIIITDTKDYGKRILVSGNGRCNISNSSIFNINEKKICYRLNNEFKSNIFDLNDKVLFEDFLSAINLDLYYDDEGRAYPFSLNASSFLNNLLNFVFDKKYQKRLKIIIDKVIDVDSKNKTIYGASSKYTYTNLFISTGGISYDREESTFLSCFKGFNRFVPALGPVVVDFSWPLRLSGVKVKGKLSFDNGFHYEEYGELLFKDKKLSGIAIFNASLLADDATISFDFAEYKNNIARDRKNYSSYLPPKIVDCLKDLRIVDGVIKFKIKKLPSFKESQISRGGIDFKLINKSNYKYLLDESISFGGEVIDLSGICGGYNISFAILSGIKAGKH